MSDLKIVSSVDMKNYSVCTETYFPLRFVVRASTPEDAQVIVRELADKYVERGVCTVTTSIVSCIETDEEATCGRGF